MTQESLIVRARHIKMARHIYCICLGALLLLLNACAREQEATVLHLAHTLDSNHAIHKAMVFMDERLRLHSGGAMQLTLYPSGQLGNDREAIELLQIGSLAMANVSASPLEGFAPQFKIFNVPYVFRGADHYQQVLDSDIGQRLLDTLLPVRLKGLGYYDAGSRSFYTVDRPIRTPGDLTGLKIRVQESQTALRMVSALGGSATPIAYGELYTALQQGVVDGAENNPPSFFLSRHYEICKYYTLDEHTAVPDVLIMGTVAWGKLTQQQKNWLRLAVRESVDFQRVLWQTDTNEALAAVEAAGVEVIRPDKTEFRTEVAAMHQSYANSPVGALISEISRAGQN